ncbi:hypothetical protein BGW38_008901 [Lunasporangiospora selenospora]|uniref:FAD-binding FR-type domain-containing protein n=1 Tax=Lunasporangiospora selenospora TaxID=979761 RepID=A0A9P6FY97_9FUNG|nr:hypothetical protein BGW38_008901 [Lunasporangiospora selenospora]
MVALSNIIIGICLGLFVGWAFADYFKLWQVREPVNDSYNADIYLSLTCLLPILLGHFITIWGNYFRAQSVFQKSIRKITQPSDIKYRTAFWERHDPYLGYTYKFWGLTSVVVIMNLYRFILTAILSHPVYVERFGAKVAVLRAIVFGAGQCVLLDSSIILFLILRRSMLHAIGYTYPEIIPLHRWVGISIIWWGTVHMWFYCAYLIMVGRLQIDIAFTDTGRGTRNMPGVLIWIALVLLGLFALPKVRRLMYPVFIYSHRVGAFVFFAGLIMHYPSFMMWYYLLPSFVLFFIDRFVPRMIQARSIHPEAICTLNPDADIIQMRFTSHEPMKPYYPGDYVKVQVPGLGNVSHPFTVASYWPEDPYSITLFMRVLTGAAITTFMALIKAIAAQIASSSEPLRMQVYLICTFRTRSELHAYGSFLHQITRDPRFTSWLHVEIYVSRPDKVQTLLGTHAHLVKSDTQVPGNTRKTKVRRFASLRQTGSRLTRVLSGKTLIEVTPPTENEKLASEVAVVIPPPTLQFSQVEEPMEAMSEVSLYGSNSSVTTKTLQISQEEKNVSENSPGPIDIPGMAPRTRNLESLAQKNNMTYQNCPLLTFEEASASSVSKRLAKMDLVASAILVLVPLAIFYGLRVIHWEGYPRWCPLTTNIDRWTIFICYWAYSVIPPVIQSMAMLILGYSGIWVARKAHLRRDYTKNSSDPETGRPKLGETEEGVEKQHADDGNWDEGDVVYSQGRMDVHKVLKSLTEIGVGSKDKGQVAVLVGGPDGFLNMIEQQVKKTDWDVILHRETWAP